MTDIRAIKSVPSAKVEIRDDEGAPTGVFFELAGPTHPKRKAIAMNTQRKLQAQYQKTGKFTLDDPEDQEAKNRENLAAFTLGWEGWTENGKPVPFSQEAALALYSDDSMTWLVEQLTKALNESEIFMVRSASR